MVELSLLPKNNQKPKSKQRFKLGVFEFSVGALVIVIGILVAYAVTQTGGSAINPTGKVPQASLSEVTSDPQGLESDADRKDTDYDGLSDREEAIIGTDPTIADTDHDGYSDGDEVANNFDPLTAATNNQKIIEDTDIDQDGLTDSLEKEINTNPYHPDTDGDGFDDKLEYESGNDPLVPSTN